MSLPTRNADNDDLGRLVANLDKYITVVDFGTEHSQSAQWMPWFLRWLALFPSRQEGEISGPLECFCRFFLVVFGFCASLKGVGDNLSTG